MSSIGGPGGVGGPKGPGGIGGPDRPDGSGEVSGAAPATGGERAAEVGEFDRIAADIASGKLTRQQAIDQMIDQMAGTDQLAAPERAELREILADLVANDPYLSSLLGRV
jgi:hypothetical protein